MSAATEQTPLVEADAASYGSSPEDLEDRFVEDLEESAYTATMMVLVRDSQKIAAGSKHKQVRTLRMLCALLLLWILISIQIFLLIEIKIFVTSPSVGAIREAYNHYEHVMYNDHVRDTGWGFHVGVGGPDGPHYHVENFNKLTPGQQDTICQIPFSQWDYLACILLIWSLTIVGELKICTSQLYWLWVIPNVDLSHSMKREEIADYDGKDDIILGLPRSMKALIASLLILPRIFIAVILCWLGCRWLAATLDFQEVLINAVALEFIIALNYVIYEKLTSDRSKRELSNTKLDVRHEGGQEPTAASYVGSLAWGALGAFWVWYYIFRFQMVLPGYQWDVKIACKAANAEKYSFWKI